MAGASAGIEAAEDALNSLLRRSDQPGNEEIEELLTRMESLGAESE